MLNTVIDETLLNNRRKFYRTRTRHATITTVMSQLFEMSHMDPLLSLSFVKSNILSYLRLFKFIIYSTYYKRCQNIKLDNHKETWFRLHKFVNLSICTFKLSSTHNFVSMKYERLRNKKEYLNCQ